MRAPIYQLAIRLASIKGEMTLSVIGFFGCCSQYFMATCPEHAGKCSLVPHLTTGLSLRQTASPSEQWEGTPGSGYRVPCLAAKGLLPGPAATTAARPCVQQGPERQACPGDGLCAGRVRCCSRDILLLQALVAFAKAASC